jgi:hypothetical protein
MQGFDSIQPTVCKHGLAEASGREVKKRPRLLAILPPR